MQKHRMISPRNRLRIGVIALLTFVFIAAALLFLFNDKGTSEADQFMLEIDQARRDLYSGYTQPIRQEFAQARKLCESTKPGSDSPDCTKLVETIIDADKVLVTATARLNALLDGAPAEVPQKFLVDMRSVEQILENLHESNTLLIDGWKGADEAKWDAGWALRRQTEDTRQSLESQTN